MHIHYITIFPEIFENFLACSLVHKAIEKKLLHATCSNPRNFCTDKHQQIDDEIYGWWAGMLMKAQPIIDTIQSIITQIPSDQTKCIILLNPSKTLFNQKIAHDLSEVDHLIFICGRYEGIDHRVSLRCQTMFPHEFMTISIGQVVTLWGEVPAMLMTESIIRLIPQVINDSASWQDESYRPEHEMTNIEYPQYTRPLEVAGYQVPDILLSGHHAEIDQWRKDNSNSIIS